ncbi:Anti-sigma-28 factor FlgM family protein [Denitrovibrio acetiphilus DSM 12809]|uniref:Negative regulator of flagellin synthesis n=1 Tax=Denitrovibrio acetiphilus (strain DSM 12809 / NBRC 114555 / N2460) TaxID=522772 RepID=D4H4A5_DENA2|nr:flagellar biosynthesis anti-sigma factor FlgM [Denitrovibrio acetiphilus]ADD69234.1 Anti-sigma-28 factor FlgM family protein [Denitrovibrio acetiphilus DSM 12809]
MRIDDKFKQLDMNKLNDTAASKKKGAKSPSASESNGGDSVSLSNSAKNAASITEAVKSSPEVRTELVQELKAKIESGQYNVSGRDIAEKLVQTAVDDLF